MANLQAGTIDLILGPMFSGKTTQLIHKIDKFAICKKCCLIKHSIDDRYGSTNEIKTHTGAFGGKSISRQNLIIISVAKLSQVEDVLGELSIDLNTIEVIGIDEGQFFDDLCEYSNKWANNGKIITISALDGTYDQEQFPAIKKIIPYCTSFYKLTAVCELCGDMNAHLTQIRECPTTDKTNKIIVGGKDKYFPICRSCFSKQK